MHADLTSGSSTQGNIKLNVESCSQRGDLADGLGSKSLGW